MIKNEFKKGIFESNPVLVLGLGLCPLLAVSNTFFNALGMGITTTFVLICSNLLVSLLRKFIIKEARIVVFIIIISTFVTISDYIVAAYFPFLHGSLGIFIPLIVVNCIILGRAEAFAYKNSIFSSFIDALGMGAGFILVIISMGFIRELLGNGTIFGTIKIFDKPALLMILPPGGFLTLGFLMVLVNIFKKDKNDSKQSCIKECPETGCLECIKKRN